MIALPVAYYLMSIWLNGFTYHINLDLWIFIVAMVFSVIISYLTVISQIIQGARVKAVDVLKYE